MPALSAAQVGLAEHGWIGETPLWFYILKEAEVLHDGDRLGPVGGRIVGEVLVGIIDADPESFRSVDPGWSPTLPGRRAAPSASPTSWRRSTEVRRWTCSPHGVEHNWRSIAWRARPRSRRAC